jgi:hypothetical protein
VNVLSVHLVLKAFDSECLCLGQTRHQMKDDGLTGSSDGTCTISLGSEFILRI